MLSRTDGEPALSEPSDEYLVRRAQDGYVDAYEELVRRHAAMTYRVALRMLGNHHDAEDVAQEALTTGWRRLAAFRGRSTFDTWLYRIVTRTALNRINRGRLIDSLDLLAAADHPAAPVSGQPEQAAERQATSDTLAASITALPPSQRIVTVLHYLEGLPYDEVARITGSTEAAVRGHLYRARRTLAVALSGWGGERG